MDTRDNYFHWKLQGHVLFPGLELNSFLSFAVASLLTCAICFSERFISFVSERRLGPRVIRRSRWSQASWRAFLFGLASFLRLLYMLVAMSFHFGLLLVIVTSLATAQFTIELHRSSSVEENSPTLIAPLLHSDGMDSATRPRSKKPSSIFIHPNHSNIARADAVALELGLPTNDRPRNEDTWNGYTRRDSQRPFRLVDDESDSD